MFVEVRDPHSRKLLFRYDPARDLIEIKEGRAVALIDLAAYKEKTGESQDRTDRGMAEGPR